MKLTGDARSIERRVTLLDNIYKIACLLFSGTTTNFTTGNRYFFFFVICSAHGVITFVTLPNS